MADDRYALTASAISGVLESITNELGYVKMYGKPDDEKTDAELRAESAMVAAGFVLCGAMTEFGIHADADLIRLLSVRGRSLTRETNKRGIKSPIAGVRK